MAAALLRVYVAYPARGLMLVAWVGCQLSVLKGGGVLGLLLEMMGGRHWGRLT